MSESRLRSASPRAFALAMCLIAAAGFGCKKVAPPGNYDLASKSISWQPNPVEVGDLVIFTYSVDNLDSSRIPDRTYDVDFYVDGKLVSFDHATSAIYPGLQTVYSTSPGTPHFRATQAGTFSYKLVLDPDNRLKETDETNNIITGSFVVRAKRTE